MGNFFLWLFRSPSSTAHTMRICLALVLVALALWMLRDAIAHAFWQFLTFMIPVFIIYFLVSSFRKR